MAKVTFEYTLPEETYEFNLHSRANKMSCALWEIQEELRRYHRYNKSDDKSKDEVIDELYTYICEIVYNARGDET